jgi:hypothetical protein
MASGLEDTGRLGEDDLELSIFRRSIDLGAEIVLFPAFGRSLLDEADSLAVDAFGVPFKVAGDLRTGFAVSPDDPGLVYSARIVGVSGGG